MRVLAQVVLWFSLALAPGLAVASGPGSEGAHEALVEAAAALRGVRAVQHDFVYGDPEDPTGWVTGTTRMRQVTDPSDSWLHVSGVVHAQPRFGVAEQRFEYAVDGRRAYLLDHTARTFQSAPLGAGSNALSLSAIFGFITEFVEPRPFWKELEHATSLSLLQPQEVDGVTCDVVRLTYGEGEGSTVVTWWLGSGDRLPRRGEWRTVGSTGPPLTMAFPSMSTGHAWEAGDFALTPPSGYDTAEVEVGGGVGRVLPSIELASPSGEAVALRDLGGQVLVLDFWNTWCYICRTQMPALAELAAELQGRGVRFFGVNVFETGDPVAYWSEKPRPYPILLEGDALANALDLPYQPGIAVVDAEGTVVFSQLGGSPDRAQKVRSAVNSALARSR